MKQILLLTVGLLGLCTVGLTSAKADSGYDDDREYHRPVYHERCHDDCDYRPQRRVVIVREYERPYYVEYNRSYYHRRHHRANFFLPLPPPPF